MTGFRAIRKRKAPQPRRVRNGPTSTMYRRILLSDNHELDLCHIDIRWGNILVEPATCRVAALVRWLLLAGVMGIQESSLDPW